LPTTLEYAGIQAPSAIREVKQDSIQGSSFVSSFTDAKAPTKHTEQYYYIFGSRAVYKDGWKAAAAHHPDIFDEFHFADEKKDSVVQDYDKDVWELYNLNDDPTERIDLAKKYPEKLNELKAQFDADAERYHIYPFIDWDDVFHQRIHKNKTK
jgi:arylsulfatase